ncbi:alpha-(1,3)-fucosyltransferase 10-like [Saccostrea echinata]|uniref:alpha-(1,3)-fucosyltransferase 10-like n=1 Tax=Saccostrea echinata TaxID=191078 RepID=UPI002A7FDF6E|nr:alpha-(1,3)-fucosyltransferase 10-like [Saccostrea echinata]
MYPIGLVLLLFVLLYARSSNNSLYLIEKKLHQSSIKNDIGNITKLHPTILWWTTYGGKTDENITCGEIKCRVSVDRTLKSHKNVMAIVFYGTSLELADMPLPRNPDVIWALKHEESPKNNDFMFSHEEIMTLFNYTSTFKRQSDYPLPTQSLPNLDYLLDRTFVVDTKTKSEMRKTEDLAPVLYVQSDCGAPSDRDQFVKLLQKYISVDSYGRCLHNKDLPEHIRFEFGKSMAGMHHDDFFKLAAKYKFTLAMENAVCEDYMTEKLWRPLRLGSLPIIFGSPKVKDYLPSNKSAILITDFKSAEQLANFLKELDESDEKYNEYLKFKFSNTIENQYLISHMQSREWGDFSAIQKTPKKFYSHMSGFDCFICQKIHEIQKARDQNESPTLHIAHADHYGCPAPRRFDGDGKYGVYSEWFAEPWLYSKYLAKAFRKYYDRYESNFTHTDLLVLSKRLRKEDKV